MALLGGFPMNPATSRLQQEGNLFLTPKRSPVWTPRIQATACLGLRIQMTMIHATGLSRYAEGRLMVDFPKMELCVSPYDTAWVAMVPSPTSPHVPCFPECIEWIVENQARDGSWAPPDLPPFLEKAALSSTLACILALKRWNVGRELVKTGLDYIGSKFSLANDERQHSPIGFDIIFSGMLRYAEELGLDLPMNETALETMFQKRDMELKRSFEMNSEARKIYIAYVAEGLDHSQDWKGMMKYQGRNGSLFNSPSSTAAVLTHFMDAKGLQYLRSVLKKFGNAVPAVYPSSVYLNLCTIETIEKLGISYHFEGQINGILDEIYICWLRSDDEIFLDITTCAMAFRLLRLHGYGISEDVFDYIDYGNFPCHFGNIFHDIGVVLELYKASQIKISQNEKILENLNSWSRNYLKQNFNQHANHTVLEEIIIQEANYALKFPYHALLDRLEHKRKIESYEMESFLTLKKTLLFKKSVTDAILRLAVDDFNNCQFVYRDELETLERWFRENKLDQLKFARQKVKYCYFSAAATLFSPKMSDVRISWAKNSVLTTVIDDFFDIGGCEEELVNFVELVKRWDGDFGKKCVSEQVKIVFSALYITVNELGFKASALQGRDVTVHITEIWLELINSMMKEFEWARDMALPTLEEYMDNGYVSFALGPIILPALYFVGPKLPGNIVRSAEYHNLYKLVSTSGRLLNDMQSFEREGKEGKLNSLSLRILHGQGAISHESAKEEMRRIVDIHRTELLKLVLQNEDSVVHRACKDLFWKMNSVLHMFYSSNDGFSSPTEMMGAVNAVIYEHLMVSQSTSVEFISRC